MSWGRTPDSYLLPRIGLDVEDSVVLRARHNLIPNPAPRPTVTGLTGWNATEAGGTQLVFEETAGGGIHYEATADAGGAQLSVHWNDATQLPVVGWERYALALAGLDVVSLPDVNGFLRLALLWFDSVGTPLEGTAFGAALTLGTHNEGAPGTRLIGTAPSAAAYVRAALMHNTVDDTGSATALEWTSGRWMLEPLGPPPPVVPGAVVNLVTAPTLGHCVPADPAGGGDGFQDGSGWAEHVGGHDPGAGPVVWANTGAWTATRRPGGRSRRHAITSGAVTLPGTMYKGFVGSYINPAGQSGFACVPGEVFGFADVVNVIAAGPVGDPGAWLEMVWYYYDGDPAHTVVIRHDNSAHLLTPEAVALGVRRLSMTGTCPEGANVLQCVSVLATSEPGVELDFYADSAIVVRLDSEDDPLPAWFDGDTRDAGWDGVPGYSTSRRPGVDAVVPGASFDGDTPRASWVGEPGGSASTIPVYGPGWLSGAAVGSWSLDREMVASTIPGNIRQRTGLSIGAASAAVRPTGQGTGQGMRATPWAKTPAKRVTTGLAATLYAEAPGALGGDRLPLGAWVTDETDGALSGEDVSVELLEASYVARDVPPLLPPYAVAPFTPGMPVDPVWPISRLLEQVGFPATPRPSSPDATLLVVPMDGAIHATSQSAGGAYVVSGVVGGGWSRLGERGLLAGGSGSSITAVSALHTVPISSRLAQSGAVVYTLDVVGTVYLVDVVQSQLVRVVNDPDTGTHTIAVSNDLTAVKDVQVFAPGGSEVWPDRVQIEISRTGSIGNWTELCARARSGPDAAWSAASIDTAAGSIGPDYQEAPRVVGGATVPGVSGIAGSPPPGRFAAVAISTDADDPGLWAPPKAILQPLSGDAGGDAGLPWTPAGIDVWEAIQDAASAYGAAVIVDLAGMARVLTPADLAGATDAPGSADPIDVGAELDDLPWTLDPEDTADRVAVTYTPPAITTAVVGSTALAPIVWQADDVVEIAAGATVTIPAVFDGRAAVGICTRFITPEGDPSAWWSQSSNLVAFDTPDGTGTPLAGSLVDASVVQTSPTTATVTVINRTSGTVYLVDGNGEPCLILRARLVATYDTPQLVERGAAAEDAVRPLEVDLTPWVQSKDQSQAIADRLWGRLVGGGLWKASSVRCRLDWSLDIGQVRPLVHEGSGLGVQALITKVHYDGGPGQIAQSLDLVLVPWTYADHAAAWATDAPGASYADHAAAWGPTRTYADFAIDPLRTGA